GVNAGGAGGEASVFDDNHAAAVRRALTQQDLDAMDVMLIEKARDQFIQISAR
ncbi:hypothetical protein U1Q18_042911, partial [Sarracenia purpurea var. burkii]